MRGSPRLADELLDGSHSNRVSPTAHPGAATTSRVGSLAAHWDMTLRVLRAPRVCLRVYGDDEARSVYRAFTARHRRFWFTSAKRWGVALLRLPDTYDEYARSTSRLVRRRRNRALERGYRYEAVDPASHMTEVLEVNASTPIRQGRPMANLYLDRDQMRAMLSRRPIIHAILDGTDHLRAYADLVDIGDAYTFAFLIGHASCLEDGVMYLLMTEVVRYCIDARRTDGSPGWLMADTFWGASAGLAYFKERVGFRPFTVDWQWTERPATQCDQGSREA